jgi:NAD(P)-dependent dehydrogenase (short-subunit alcohol dehydrogenase family)
MAGKQPLLAGKAGMVTGGGSGMGRSAALALAAEGAEVLLVGRRAEPLEAVCAEIAAFGGTAHAFAADLADEAATRGLLAQTVAHFGALDAVVNSAAVFEYDNAQSFGHASLDQHLRTNTAGPILLAQALHAHVSARSARGVVVNLLDQKLWNQNPDFLSYTLSKAALEAATTMLAMALAPTVRVAGVAPGLTLTSPMLSDEKFEALHKLSPLGYVRAHAPS